jgi:hypothetical protein
MTWSTVALVALCVGGTFYLTREWMMVRGPVTQAEEAAGIINSIGNLAAGVGAAVATYKDTVQP